MPKSIRNISTFQTVPKIEKIYPRFILRLKKRSQAELITDCGEKTDFADPTFGEQGPQGAAPSTRTRQKEEGERQKERRSKKEEGKWRKIQGGSEHASGQRPCEIQFLSSSSVICGIL